MRLDQLGVSLEAVEHALNEQPFDEQPLDERPRHKPRFQHTTSWSRIEEQRDPTGYESAEYTITRDPDQPQFWWLQREPYKGYAAQPMMRSTSYKACMEFSHWLVANDRQVAEALYNMAHGKEDGYLAIIQRGASIRKEVEAHE